MYDVTKVQNFSSEPAAINVQFWEVTFQGEEVVAI